jgi:hypothetical protein
MCYLFYNEATFKTWITILDPPMKQTDKLVQVAGSTNLVYCLQLYSAQMYLQLPLRQWGAGNV